MPERDRSPGAVADYPGQVVHALARQLRWQAIAGTLLAVALLLLRDGAAAGSALCGGFAAWLPGALFAWAVARRLGGDSAAFLRAAALAELGKLTLTGVLCAAAFIWVPSLVPGAFFTGMITLLAVGWVGLARAAG